MAASHGKTTVFFLDTSTGGLTNLSTYVDSCSLDEVLENAETTTFGATGSAKTFIVGLQTGTFQIGGPWDPTLHAHLANVKSVLAAGTLSSVTFEYGPEGNSTGDRKQTGECLLTNFSKSSPVGDKATFTASFQVTGVITETTY